MLSMCSIGKDIVQDNAIMRATTVRHELRNAFDTCVPAFRSCKAVACILAHGQLLRLGGKHACFSDLAVGGLTTLETV